MRRSEKQITDQNELIDILDGNTICRIAFSDNDIPYIVPMNYGYAENKIYLHTAQEGRKMQILERNNSVCFEITDSIEIVKSEVACDFGTNFRSIIGFGTITPVMDFKEKLHAIRTIMKQHTNKDHWEFPDKKIDMFMILEITIEKLTGKKSGM